MSRKIGRNEKCPCGSGKKYKQCCLAKDEAAARSGIGRPGDGPAHGWSLDEDDLDQLSNSVIHLIKANDFVGAEAACHRLAVEHPDQIDGIERLALVREAQGRTAEAAELFLRAAAFAATHAGFEPDSVQWFTEQAARLTGGTGT